MSIKDQKAEWRKAAFTQRKVANAAESDSAANKRLLSFLNINNFDHGEVISAYLPIRTEISPLAAMDYLAHQNEIVVPEIAASNQPLKWLKWEKDVELVEGAFGVMLPKDKNYLTPHIMICPLVAFDQKGYRLGYGGGFYDRSIEGIGAPLTIGFAYDGQEIPEVPIEATDQRLDVIITPKRCIISGTKSLKPVE